ncbi:MAG: [protein-PII] uridylyltransferase, partial [Rickettsiales bacterium]
MKKNVFRNSIVHTNLKQPSLAEQLAVIDGSFADNKVEALEICRNWLEVERAILKAEFLANGKVLALLSRHTKLIDTLLNALYFEAENPEVKMVVIAVGGYGRNEMFPYSDIDLLFLYNPADEASAAQIVESILYVLWDLGFKVGQSHRTIEESIQLAKADITIRTNLLDARHVVGDVELFELFRNRFDDEIIDGKVSEFIEAKLVERDKRHQRFGDSRYMLEPNIKEGKGGLRDTHTLWWLARAAYSLSNNSELVEHGLISRVEYKAFEKARNFLCRVRAHLHYITERPEDRLTFDYQHKLAVAMGFSHPSINRSIERFMRRYFVAVRTIGSTTRVFCALLEDSKKRKPRISLAGLLYMPWNLSGFKIDGERLNVRSEDAFEKSPIMMIELFRVAQSYGLQIHPQALQLIVHNLHRIDHELSHNPKANSLFLEILLSEKSAESTLRLMSEVGVLGFFIRDFGRVVGQTQFNMYHVYTVDEHTLVAIGILHAVENGKMKSELPLASDIIHRIRLRRVLYVALFCHDLAKGRGGDHSVLGEKVGIKLATRLGFSHDEIQTVGWLVRYHLLFTSVATKRDLNDPKTIQDFVAAVQSPERLKLLIVLTIADIRAVSPVAWNTWKGVLLGELYNHAEQYMGTGKLELKQFQATNFHDNLRKLLIGWKDHDIDHYIKQGSSSFWASVEPARHSVIARMVRESENMTQPILLDTQHNYERSITELIICTIDQSGLFSKIAGAIALSGANIINAKIFTLKNGLAVEIFQLQDLNNEVFDRADKLAKMSVYIEQVLSGELDISEAFSKKSSPYLKSRNKSVPLLGQVFIDNEASNVNSVIEFTGRDRAGLLHDATKAISEMGLSIVTAHISTYGTQVSDVFYVKDNFGMKIVHQN